MDEPGRDEGSDKHAASLARAEKRSGSIVGELIRVLGASSRWWLAPMIVLLLLMGLALVLAGTAAGPFIYNVF